MLNRITINTAFQIATRILELVSGLVVNAWLARQWGSQAFGQVGHVSSLAGLCSFLFDLGLSNLLVRSVSRDKEKARHYLLNGLMAILPLSLVGSLVIVAAGMWTTTAAYLPVLVLVSLQMVLSATAGLFRGTFYAYERMEFESIPVILDRLAWIGGGLWLSFLPPTLVGLFAWVVCCKSLNTLVSAYLFFRHIWPLAEPARLSLKAQLGLLRQSVPFGLNLAFSTVYVSLDILLVAHWAGDDQAGYYRAASMLLVPLTLVAAALNNSLFPRVSHAAKHDPQSAGAFSMATIQLVLALAMPVGLFVALFAEPLVLLLFGSEYRPAAQMLQILSLVVPLRYLNNSLAASLTAHNQQARRTVCAGIAAAFNVVANVIVIQRYQAFGACLTTLATDLLIVVLLAYCLNAHLGRQSFQLLRGLGSLAVAAAILVPLALLKAPLLVTGLTLAVCYPLLLYRARLLSSFELGLLLRRS